jgi:hypothetical protein
VHVWVAGGFRSTSGRTRAARSPVNHTSTRARERADLPPSAAAEEEKPQQQDHTERRACHPQQRRHEDAAFETFAMLLELSFHDDPPTATSVANAW